MSIHISTGITPNYVERAEQFLDTSERVCNVPVTIFAVDFTPEQLPVERWEGLRWMLADYQKSKVQLPKRMGQAGNFSEWAPQGWNDSDIIIYCDADAFFQRPFTEDERALFRSTPPSAMRAGYNMANGRQTLSEEATRLQPKIALDEIIRRFPYCDHMECRNFGFVVADLATWKQLYAAFNAIWTRVDACFHNPAKVQWCALYALQSTPGMKLLDLPDTTHAHGHVGRRAGLEKGADGLWRQDGVVVAFAHAL